MISEFIELMVEAKTGHYYPILSSNPTEVLPPTDDQVMTLIL
jgi:hypothetical protein